MMAFVRIAQSRLDSELAIAAEYALHKVVDVLPPWVRATAESLALQAPESPLLDATRRTLQRLREAIEGQRMLRFGYRDLKNLHSRHQVRPRACFYWDAVWILGA